MPPPLLSDIDVALFAVLIPVPLPSALFAMQARERLNPNLYETGKVCLSLLGTWNGKTRHTFETRPLRPKKNPPFFLEVEVYSAKRFGGQNLCGLLYARRDS